ncbi:MAG: hypothetical protein MPJ04_02345 [Nitrosopumilus sp.]|nr:hypothetical protein [Nitrosopumilus sp.]MDA7954485.1 hypothetical protein [Nitrosopumilus sp.]MDA7973516.1 hypothetical protein [Nitrosopumilus sp.]MDA7997318.1 hypothetical protein [Nitrosopumilus sp.]
MTEEPSLKSRPNWGWLLLYLAGGLGLGFVGGLAGMDTVLIPTMVGGLIPGIICFKIWHRKNGKMATIHILLSPTLPVVVSMVSVGLLLYSAAQRFGP